VDVVVDVDLDVVVVVDGQVQDHVHDRPDRASSHTWGM
jgi:hypothetical protein